MHKSLLCYLISSLLITSTVHAQDDFLESLIEEENRQFATSAFKATRIINAHSIKQPDKGELEFRISHRFGRLNGGLTELWGLDQATIHFSLEFSPLERLTLGAGRSNYNKTYDGYAKISLLKQQTGIQTIPVSVSYFTSFESVTAPALADIYDLKHRMYYVHQLLVARKFSRNLSLQLMPTLVHRNLTDNEDFSHDILSIGLGGRYKITRRLTFNVETFLLTDTDLYAHREIYFPVSVGVDLQPGGHVFQIMLSNSLPMREVGFITATDGYWRNGDIHLGFNISRMFNLY
ncbi:MAG: DUF5777 family beta-barrel protein [Bacteroidota bacterium]